MYTVPALLGIACLISMWVAAQSRDPDAVLITRLLAVLWIAANLLWWMDALWLLPAFDWIIGMLSLTMLLWGSGASWLGVIVQLIMVRLVFHALDYLTGHGAFVTYAHFLNVTYAGLLFAAASSGGANARDNLRRFFHRLRPGPSSAPLSSVT